MILFVDNREAPHSISHACAGEMVAAPGDKRAWRVTKSISVQGSLMLNKSILPLEKREGSTSVQ